MNSQNKMVYMQKILNPSSYRSTEMNKESLTNIMIDSINKAIDPNEVPIKEKHVRRLIIGTFETESGTFFWQYLPLGRLKESQIVCWKFCYILHKLLRDGHKQVFVCSQSRRQTLLECGNLWRHVDGYGKLIHKYCTLLFNRINFLTRHPTFPHDLKLSDNQLDEIIGGQDIEGYFDFCCEIFDALEDLLVMQDAVLKTVEDKGLNSMMKVGQCHLYPLVACIQDSSLFYDYSVKCLFKCYSQIEAAVLEGHKNRFTELHNRLKNIYQRESKLQYFKTLIQIPRLPEGPPNFEVASNLKQHTTPKVILISDSVERESPDEMLLVNLDEEAQLSPSSSTTTMQHNDFPPTSSLDVTASSASLPVDPMDSLISPIEATTSSLNDTSQSEAMELMSEKIGNFENFSREMEERLAELLRTIEQLKLELEEEKKYHSNTKDDCEKMRRDASNLKHQLANTKNEFNRLQEECTRAKHDNEISQEAMKKLMRDLNELKGKQQQQSSQLEKQYQVDKERLERELASQQLEKQQQQQDLERQRQAENDKREEDLLAAEMNSAEKIIREATKKIEELAEKSRKIEQDGTKLQVNEKISEVCTNLMMAVKNLIAQSRILQREIVLLENGKSSSASHDDFYKRNSKWTNGLISAAQEVAMTAKALVDVADRSMSGASKFNELAAAAHEVATATTQLVVASRVKANKDSEKLKNFSTAARQVNQCTVNIVEASRACANLVGQSDDESQDLLDLSSMSLHQTKQKEIESQIRIMELETELSRERKRLGFLRRQHYEQEEAQQQQVSGDTAEHQQQV